jgi:hypothetical protein
MKRTEYPLMLASPVKWPPRQDDLGTTRSTGEGPHDRASAQPQGLRLPADVDLRQVAIEPEELDVLHAATDRQRVRLAVDDQQGAIAQHAAEADRLRVRSGDERPEHGASAGETPRVPYRSSTPPPRPVFRGNSSADHASPQVRTSSR